MSSTIPIQPGDLTAYVVLDAPAGGVSPFNLIPIPYAHAAWNMIALQTVPLYRLPLIGPVPLIRPRPQFDIVPAGSHFVPRRPLGRRIVIVWSDRAPLLQQVLDAGPALLVVLVSTDEIAAGLRLPAGAQVVTALTPAGAIRPDFAAAVWSAIVSLHKPLLDITKVHWYPDRQRSVTVADLLAAAAQQTWLPAFHELEPTRLRGDLLVKSNEIMRDLARGKLPLLASEPAPRDSAAAAVELAWEIFATRGLMTLFDFVLQDLPIPSYAEAGLTAEFRDTISDATGNADFTIREAKFAEAVRTMPIRPLAQLAPHQLVLVCPSISVLAAELSGADPGPIRFAIQDDVRLPQPYARAVIRALVRGGRRLVVPQPKSPEERTFVQMIVGSVRAEAEYASAIAHLHASQFTAPVLKCERIPERVFARVRDVMTRFAQSVTEGDVEERAIAAEIGSLSAELTEGVPRAYRKFISELRMPHVIHALADIPVELVRMGGDYLGYTTDISRTPLTPGIVPFANAAHTEIPSELPLTEGEFLLLTPFGEDDPDLESLWSNLASTFWKMTVRRITRPSDFLEAVRSDSVSAILYFGHAHYDQDRDEVGLELEEGWISRDDLERVPRYPRLNFIIGCNTGAAGSALGSIPSILLTRGATLVVGTTFAVEKRIAARFLLNLLDHIFRPATPPRDLAVILRRTRVSTRFASDLLSLQRSARFSDETADELMLTYAKELFQASYETEDERRKALLAAEHRVLAAAGLLKKQEQHPFRIPTIPYPLFFSLFGYPWATFSRLWTEAIKR